MAKLYFSLMFINTTVIPLQYMNMFGIVCEITALPIATIVFEIASANMLLCYTVL